MVEKENDLHKVNGVEAIVIHNGNLVLGMQQPRRWYTLENGENACIIKTLGGRIEKEDENNCKKALMRELFEEVKDISEEDIRVTKKPIFTKKIKMGQINPFDKQNNLNMMADFYILEIMKKENINPNDLPALFEIPINKFTTLKFGEPNRLSNIENYMVKNNEFSNQFPEVYAFLIPEEVKYFLEKIRIDEKQVEEDIER